MRKNVCVIGAGPSGLVAAKELLAEDHSVTCFERSADLGGVFRSGAGPDEPGHYDSTLLTISNYMMAFSSFPPPEHQERRYWTASEYRQYLRDFAAEFGIGPTIRYRMDVLSVAKDERGGYAVEVAPVDDPAARAVHRFDAVVVSTGTHRVPNYLELPGQDDFAGEIVHSAYYRNPERFRGLRVLCVGIGETGSDVANEVARVAQSCTLSVRRHQPVVARYPGGRGHTNDTYTTYMLNSVPLRAASAVQRVQAKLGRKHGKSAAGKAVADWNSKNRHFFNHFLTKNESFLHRVVDGTLTVNSAGIERIGADHVLFKDGQLEQIDTIVLNTGYVEDFDILKDVRVDDVRTMYKHMIHPDLGTGIVFIGWARPAAGGVPACSEMQSRYFALLCSGKKKLPTPARLKALTARQTAYEDEVFFGNPGVRTLVHYNNYMIDFAEVLGCSPWRRALLRDPRLAFRLWCGSQVPTVYRLFGPHSDHAAARRTVLSLPSGFTTPEIVFGAVLIGVSRVLTAMGLMKRDPTY